MSDDHSWNPPAQLPIEQMWEAFENLTAVRTLDLKASIASGSPVPQAPLFPNLVSVRIEVSTYVCYWYNGSLSYISEMDIGSIY